MSGAVYQFGPFALDVAARELRRDHVAVALSPRAFDCIRTLIEHRARALGKDELITAIWGRSNVSDTQLGQTILLARRALGDDGQAQHFIRTVSRHGYRWVAEVQHDAASEPVLIRQDPVQAPERAPFESVAIGLGESSPGAAPHDERQVRARAVRWLSVAMAAACSIGAVVLYRYRWTGTRTEAAMQVASATVLPLSIDAAGDDSWLRLGGMDLIAARLRSGGLAVPPSESVVALIRTAGDGDAATTTRSLRAAAPTALLVSGDIAHRAQVWRVRLHAMAADGASLAVEATSADVLDAARAAADRLLARLGRAAPTERPLVNGLQERLQRAQAAMLANDLDDARAILIGDPQLAREEPQLGYRLAQLDFRAGEYARAESSLTALLTEPAAAEPVFHGRLLNGRGALRIRLDDYAGAQADYDDAVTLLRGQAPARDLGLALTGRGVTHSMRHESAQALADLGEARVQLEAAGDALGVARVDSNLGGLEMNRDRPDQALAYLDSAATQFERYGAINELMETLESLVSDNLALLRPADALAASDRSWTLAARAIDPNQRLNLTLDRVDVFLSLGRLHEAGSLLAPIPASAPLANPFLARRLPALRARLALAEGRATDAVIAARQALAMPAPSDDAGDGVAEIAVVLQRATLAASTPAAEPPAETWMPQQTPPVFAAQAVLEADWSAATGDDDKAAQLYRDALDLAERRGVPSDIALAAVPYGTWLLRHGRDQQAGEVIGRVSSWATRDFECALLQVRLFAARHQADAWSRALAQANTLAGERLIPDELHHLEP
jgi:DNA-binding winged helix-turn-helix (wHTH) protein/tetratricopeptide (TPR) repeat protein